MAVQIHPHQGPVDPRGHLLDVGRLAGAVIALDHHPAVVGEAGADGERGLGVEAIGFVQIGHVRVALAERGNLHVGIHAEHLADGDHPVGQERQQRILGFGI